MPHPSIRKELHTNIHDIYFNSEKNKRETDYFVADPDIPIAEIGIVAFIYFLNQRSINPSTLNHTSSL